MSKIIKIGFPIVCVAVIAVTFYLLNNASTQMNKNKLKETDGLEENSVSSNMTENLTNTSNNSKIFTVSKSDQKKAEEIEEQTVNKAIEVVKLRDGQRQNVYYTSEGKDDNGNFIIAIRDESTTEAIVFYSVDIENESISVY